MDNFKETKTGDLIKRIENLKAERERMADCLARLESELERRKQVVSFGVPFIPRNKEKYWFITDRGYVSHLINEDTLIDRDTIEFLNSFRSKESAEKHLEMLSDWRKDGLLANYNGEPIDIKVLLPLLKKGWVAMDKNGRWFWYNEKPIKDDNVWLCSDGSHYAEELPKCFNIKPAEDWRNSLMECGL